MFFSCSAFSAHSVGAVPEASITPIKCPGGTYGNTTHGQSSDQACTDCPERYYCPEGTTHVTETLKCPAGFFCPKASASPTPCPAATYSGVVGAITISVCLVCPAGFYCPEGTSAVQPRCVWL